jgi:hypothetical protein
MGLPLIVPWARFRSSSRLVVVVAVVGVLEDVALLFSSLLRRWSRTLASNSW